MVKISPPYFLLLAFLVAADSTDYLIAFLAASLSHELAHLTAMKFLRIPLNRMEFTFFGIAIIPGRRLSYSEEIAVALAGPLTNILTFFIFRLIGIFPRLCLCALSLGAVNLIPVYPLDGGRAVKALLKSDERYNAFSIIFAALSLIFGVIMIIFRHNVSVIILAVCLLAISRKGSIKCLTKRLKKSFTRFKSRADISAASKTKQ